MQFRSSMAGPGVVFLLLWHCTVVWSTIQLPTFTEPWIVTITPPNVENTPGFPETPPRPTPNGAAPTPVTTESSDINTPQIIGVTGLTKLEITTETPEITPRGITKPIVPPSLSHTPELKTPGPTTMMTESMTQYTVYSTSTILSTLLTSTRKAIEPETTAGMTRIPDSTRPTSARPNNVVLTTTQPVKLSTARTTKMSPTANVVSTIMKTKPAATIGSRVISTQTRRSVVEHTAPTPAGVCSELGGEGPFNIDIRINTQRLYLHLDHEDGLVSTLRQWTEKANSPDEDVAQFCIVPDGANGFVRIWSVGQQHWVRLDGDGQLSVRYDDDDDYSRFTLEMSEFGWTKIRSKATGKYLRQNGQTRVIKTELPGKDNDDRTRFYVTRVGRPTAGPTVTTEQPPQLLVRIYARIRGIPRYMMVTKNDAIVRSSATWSGEATTFLLTKQTDGSYTIISKAAGKRLHEDGHGDNLLSTRYDENDEFTRFYLEKSSAGWYRIKVQGWADNRNRYLRYTGGKFGTRHYFNNETGRFYIAPVNDNTPGIHRRLGLMYHGG